MKIYFSGMCGVMMAPLAAAMKEKGYEVEGSDKGFYPPMSTFLKNHNIKMNIGYKENNITKDIDIVVIAAAITLNNPEYIKIKELNIKHYMGYGGFVKDFLIKDNSVVVVGSYGKSTITAFTSLLLEKAQYSPSFAIGGIPLNFESGVRITESSWSVVEGDEYINSREENPVPRFMFYNPKYLILNASRWDHIDVYKTEDDYINAYKGLAQSMLSNSFIFANIDGENINKVVENENKTVIYISTRISNENESNNKLYSYIKSYNYINGFTEFEAMIDNKLYTFRTTIIGIHNIANLLMGISFGIYIGIDVNKIKEAVEEFKGVRRRLELRKETPYIVIDDLAHSPVKAKSSIDAVKEKFPDRRIIAIFEPHTLSSRMRSSLAGYKGSMDNADEILIAPVYHPTAVEENERITSLDIANAIGNKAIGFEKFNGLKNHIEKELKPEDILLFMSSGAFGGLIEYFSNTG